MKPLKRINIRYGGEHYTVANRALSEVQNEITTAIAEGRTLWLRVNRGEGTYQQADLLITAATPIALMGVDLPPVAQEPDAESDNADDPDVLEEPDQFVAPFV
jgi:hypothetical protein